LKGLEDLTEDTGRFLILAGWEVLEELETREEANKKAIA
jgi:hypothetical protein